LKQGFKGKELRDKGTEAKGTKVKEKVSRILGVEVCQHTQLLTIDTREKN
jgi:hypothetical protein